jgi:hypothetical protein
MCLLHYLFCVCILWHQTIALIACVVSALQYTCVNKVVVFMCRTPLVCQRRWVSVSRGAPPFHRTSSRSSDLTPEIREFDRNVFTPLASSARCRRWSTIMAPPPHLCRRKETQLLCILNPLTAALAENDIVWFAQPEVKWVDLRPRPVNKAAPEMPTVEVVVGTGWHQWDSETVICANRSVDAPLRVNGRDAKQWVCPEEMCPW